MSLTPEHMLDILPRVRPRDRHELLGFVPEEHLKAWAVARAKYPGVGYTFALNGEVVGVGGVLEGPVPGIGVSWGLCTDRWVAMFSDLMQVWSVVVEHGGYRRLECKCYADNPGANALAKRMGYRFEGCLRGYTLRGEDINQYGMVFQ